MIGRSRNLICNDRLFGSAFLGKYINQTAAKKSGYRYCRRHYYLDNEPSEDCTTTDFVFRFRCKHRKTFLEVFPLLQELVCRKFSFSLHRLAPTIS